MKIPKPIKALLQSRKFWLAVIAEIAAIVMFVQGMIDADKLADLTVALAGVVIAGIAIEDHGEKSGMVMMEKPEDEQRYL